MSRGKGLGLAIGGVAEELSGNNIQIGSKTPQRRGTQGLAVGGLAAQILKTWLGQDFQNLGGGGMSQRRNTRGLTIGGVAAPILKTWLEQIKGGPSPLSEQLSEQKIAQTKKPIDLFE